MLAEGTKNRTIEKAGAQDPSQPEILCLPFHHVCKESSLSFLGCGEEMAEHHGCGFPSTPCPSSHNTTRVQNNHTQQNGTHSPHNRQQPYGSAGTGNLRY